MKQKTADALRDTVVTICGIAIGITAIVASVCCVLVTFRWLFTLVGVL